MRGIFLALLLLSMETALWAFTPTVTPKGLQVKWSSSAKLNLAGNPGNQVGISSSSFYDSVVHALQRWKAASGEVLNFDYWQGEDARVFEPNSNYNGLSSIYFASNSKTTEVVAPNVLGLTQVWYNTDTGEILESDIVLNDISYHFTTDARDSTGFGSTSYNVNGGRNVFLDNVITHELGHAFGLSHSGTLQSTMLFMESPEQAYLGCDEQTAIRAIYPANDSGARGAILGTVVSETGVPIYGAHVLAISRRRGTVLASGLTDRSGRYKLAALEPGNYFLIAEPFYAGSAVLPLFYSGINPGICSGKPFGRTPLTELGGSRPFLAQVVAGSVSGVPPLVTRCERDQGATITALKTSSILETAPTIFSGDKSGFGIVDRFGVSDTLYYRVKALSGHLEVHAIAYSLYSPIHPGITLLDHSGNPLPEGLQVNYVENAYIGTSGYRNYDSVLTAENLPSGDYFLRITGVPVNESLYPAGPISRDSVPFVMITGSVNEAMPSMAGALPFNTRCRMDENFAVYTSPPGEPEHGNVDHGRSSSVGFCGSLAVMRNRSEGPSNDNDDPDSGPTAGAVVGWFLPWLLMALAAQMMRLRVRLATAVARS